MEKLYLGGAEQMEMRQEIIEGHERWLDGTKKTFMEEHPKLAMELKVGGLLVGAIGAAVVAPESVRALVPMSVFAMPAIMKRIMSKYSENYNRRVEESPKRREMRREAGI